MSKQFKRQADATKWLASVSGCFLEEGSAKGKWAAYIPPAKVTDDMIIGYGDTPVSAIQAAADLIGA